MLFRCARAQVGNGQFLPPGLADMTQGEIVKSSASMDLAYRSVFKDRLWHLRPRMQVAHSFTTDGFELGMNFTQYIEKATPPDEQRPSSAWCIVGVRRTRRWREWSSLEGP